MQSEYMTFLKNNKNKVTVQSSNDKTNDITND